MEDIFKLTQKLTNLPTVSGREDLGLKAFADIIKSFFDEYYFTPLNCFVGKINAASSDAKTILLDAHIDEIGFTVLKICDGGFLKVCANGSPDPRTLSASDVVVYGKKPIKGVFTSTPPHLQQKGDSDKPLKVDDFFIDTGLSDAECRELIKVGDVAGLSSTCQKLHDNKLVGKGFDDKICIVTILSALSKLNKDRKMNIVCQFTSCEEVGYKGALTATCGIMPDYIIALDVTNAYIEGFPEYRKSIMMEKGGVISYSGTTNIPFSKFAVNTAKKYGIPYQIAAEGNSTGTNTNACYVSSLGAYACLISVPLKYMHTASEIISLTDVDYTSQLVAKIITDLEDGNNV